MGAFHIIFLREHNRIARTLKQLNPTWNDELLFQNTRRIVNAQEQHIIYNEFLPVLLGEHVLVKYGLKTLQGVFSNSYRSDFNPSATNVFAAAAFRFGHSMVQGLIK